jgi:hypothetical protein
MNLTNGGQISTSAESGSTGNGGKIDIIAGKSVSLRNAEVSANSDGLGNAGDITINAGHTFLSENSSVTTNAKQADGGNIEINAQYMINLINSDIKASVGGGPLTVGGNISIDPEYVILKNSNILANAFQGKGGNIQIFAGALLADPNCVISASSSLGIDGKVDIHAPVKDISGVVAPLQDNFQSANALLLESCAVRMSGGEYSSLVVQGDDGLPIGPGDLLPSPLYVGEMVEYDAKVASLLDKEPLSYGINVFEEKGLLPLAMLNDESGCSTCP